MTAIETLRPAAGNRAVDALIRAGYDTVEWVAVATDRELLVLPYFGPVALAAIRRAIRQAQSEAAP